MAGDAVGDDDESDADSDPDGSTQSGDHRDVIATEVGISRADLDRLLAAASENDGIPASEGDVDDLREEFVDLIEDVRERVIQVKRETDAKAPDDHDHDHLRAQAESANARVERLAGEVQSLESTVEDLRARLDAGFDNYEEVLEYLTDATDDLDEKTTTLARAVVDLRDQTATLTARNATRAAADELAREANRHGVTSADCGHCDREVHVGLLDAPECPHCASTFSGIDPKQGFFGSNTLVVGDPPALDGETMESDIDDILDDTLTETADADSETEFDPDPEPEVSADGGENAGDSR